MPDLQTVYGGPVLFAGVFPSDDVVTVHDAVHVDGGLVQIDAGNVDGTILVQHELGTQSQPP